MSEQENPVVDSEVEVNPVEDLIDAIASQNFNQAKSHFEDVLGQKVNDALDQEKLVVADKIFNDFDEEDQLELDFEEEEVEEESLDDNEISS